MSDEYIKKDDLINRLKSEIEKLSLPFPTTAMKWKRGGFSHAKAIVESFDTVSFSSLSDSDNKGEWIYIGDEISGEFKCSVCGNTVGMDGENYRLCPYCGNPKIIGGDDYMKAVRRDCGLHE